MTEVQHLPLPATANAYDSFVDEGGQIGKLLKFVKGDYGANDKPVPVGTEYVALVSEMRRGWVRFEEGKPVEYRLGLIRDGFQFAARPLLGFNDQRQWERDRKGAPKDPWQRQVYLPLLHLESGEAVCFVTGSVGGQAALRDLVRAYRPKAATCELPIISLQADSYEHDSYGAVSIPVFRVEGWHDTGSVPPPPAPMTPTQVNRAPAQIEAPAKVVSKDEADNSDIDDSIPF